MEINICECNCTCSSPRKKIRSTSNSFPKKLLVAVSVVVVLSTCLMPTEGRSIEHRVRHHRRQSGNVALKQTKEPTRNPPDHYKTSIRKIMRILKNTRRFFNQDKRVLNEAKEHRDGNPSWLPKVNFVDIHDHNYSSTRNGSIAKRKFSYLIPRLYKSLKEYKVILELLQNVTIHYTDGKFYDYTEIRKDVIQKTLNKLNIFLCEVVERMVEVNLSVPEFDESQMGLESFDKDVNASECLKQDYIALRGYGNLLNNWNSELRCPRGKVKGRINEKCRAYEAQLKKKKDSRRPRKGRRN